MRWFLARAGSVRRTYESRYRFECIPLVEKHRDQAANGLHGGADIGLHAKFASVVQAEDGAVYGFRRQALHHLIRPQTPIIADCSPHHAGESEWGLGAAKSEPACAIRGAEPAGG